MIIEKKELGITPDNDSKYFELLEGVIESRDEFATLSIKKSYKEYNLRIIPSDPTYINSIIEELVKLHKILLIRLNFSKSIKNSSSISVKIELK